MENQTEQIKLALDRGESKEEIYKKLLDQGWKLNSIQEAFFKIDFKKQDTDTQKRTIRIVVTIGAILIGLGFFSFIAANWNNIADFIKVGIIISAMLASYALSWILRKSKEHEKTADALLLLANIIYGAGIFLIAQIFNIRANWPDGFILWMIGTIAMAFAVKSFPLFYLAIPLGIITVSSHPFFIFSSFRHDPFLLTSSFLLLIATAVSFTTAFILRKKLSSELKELF